MYTARNLLLLLFILISVGASGQSPAQRSNYQLVWEDNFDFLNEEIWRVRNHFDHWGGEPQVYTSRPENVFIQDGNLVIRVDRETYTCPPEAVNQWGCARQYNTGEPYEFTSGWIDTRQPDYNVQYGWIEARIMLPYGYGFWPAFWTFKADDPPGGTNAAEIDIFEMLGHKPPNKITTNIHLEYCNEQQPDYPICANIPSYFQENLIANYAYTYHTYAIEWTPTHLRWWIDDYNFRIEPNPGVIDPVRVILNMAIEPGYAPNSSTPFPSDMLIDHVRVYSLVTASAENGLKENDLTIYPNPATADRMVHVSAWNNTVIQELELVNSIGQVVGKQILTDSGSAELDTGNLDQGFYTLIIRTNKGEANRRLVIL